MKLDKFIEIKGNIVCKSGLRIGSTAETVGIGETDNPIIRHPITRLPYIPGSSIKGKLRSLLEIDSGNFRYDDGKPCDCGKCFVCKLFGTAAKNSTEPGRLIFRDCPVSENIPDWLQGSYGRKELEEGIPGSFVETKTEIAMNRNTGSAQPRALRQQERVPQGTLFDFSFSIRLFDRDAEKEKEYYNKLSKAFELLEKDYLGGSGTRGYGKVKIFHEKNGKPMKDYLRELAK